MLTVGMPEGEKGSPEGSDISISVIWQGSDTSLPLGIHWPKLDLWTHPVTRDQEVHFHRRGENQIYSEKFEYSALGDNAKYFTTQPFPSCVYMQRILHIVIY